MLPEVAPVFGDLDGDGVEDVVIAARCKNPMLDEARARLQGDGPLLRLLWLRRPQGHNHVQRARSGAAGAGRVDYSWRGAGRLALGNSEGEVS